MGAALFIVLERDIPGFDPFVNGKSLSRDEGRLAHAARELGVAPLMDFFSQSPEAIEEFLEDEDPGIEGIDLPDERWFDAEEGLRTVTALLEHLSESQDGASDPGGTISDLHEFERVLQRAQKEGVKWHLEVDF